MRRGATVSGAIAGVLAALALLLSGPASAVAAPAWLAPEGLADTAQTAYAPTIAAAPDGTVLAAWARSDGAQIRIETRVRPAGGEFGATVTVSPPGGSEASQPAAAFDARGDAIVAWARGGRVEAALRPAGGSFEPARVISPEVESASGPAVVFDADGNATIAWTRRSGTSPNLTFGVRARTWRADGSLGQPQDLASATTASTEESISFNAIQLAADGQGNVFAAWAFSLSQLMSPANPLGRTASSIGAAVQPAGGSFTLPATTLASGEEIGLFGPRIDSPSLAVDSDGDALVAWSKRETAGSQWIEAKARPAGGSFEAHAENIYGPATQAYDPSVAFDGDGDAVAAWAGEAGGKTSVLAAERPANGGFGPARVLSEPGITSLYPALAMTARGEALVAWLRIDATSQIEAAARPPGGDFGAARPASAPAAELDYPTLAVDGQGDAVAIWRLREGNFVPEVAGYDAAGPSLTGLSVPARGAVGASLSFSAAPLDVWSPPASTSWDFGDGGSASGTTVSHTYASGGDRTVTVTATDAIGNASSASRAIAITPAAATPGRGGTTAGKPVISKVKQSHRRWRLGGKLAQISGGSKHARGAPVGTTFSFSLTEPAKVGLSFAQHQRGRKVGRRCVAPTRGNRGHRTCPRTRIAGTLPFTGHAGPNRVRFQGRISARKRLKPGHYQLTIVATDAAGQRSAPRRLSFTIVGRR